MLYRFADAGTDPVDLLRTRAEERAFTSDPNDPARSAAQVLHYRLVRDVPYPDHGADRSDLLPGWVPTPLPIDLTDADQDHAELTDWLHHRASRIADRVHALGERTGDVPPTWANRLGNVPDDPIARELWIRRAGHVAAYRERWNIPDNLDEMLPPCRRGEQGRARQWVANYLNRNPLPSPASGDAALEPRTTRIRNRLDLLRTRMTSGPTPAADTYLTREQEVEVDHGSETTPEIDIGP